MPRFPRLGVGLVFLLLFEWSCHKRQVAAPVLPPPSPIQPAAPAASSASSPTTTPAASAKKPVRSAPAPASITAAPPAAAVPAASPPKLSDVLTADEHKQYGASIDQSLSIAQTSLNSISGRLLSKDQQGEVEQIRNFMQQAQATRNSDPAGAKSLAERAAVLARDLAKSSR
jgi:hypothetical protein